MNIPKISANFETSLASKMSAAATTFTLVSATDQDGNALSGLYGFTIEDEYVLATISGTTGTVVYRGIDADAPNTEVSANKVEHGRGAPVKISDYPIIGILREILNGSATLPNKISYNSHPTFSSDTELIDKKYADDLVIAGAPDASIGTKGLGKSSVAPASPTDPIFVGDNDPRVPTQGENDALVGNNTTIAVGTGNKMVTQTGLQNKAETYAASTGSANAYVLTLSPAPTAYATGQEFEFKANFANTAAATLNVNSLGAKTIKKADGATDLASGDIANGQLIKVKYDGTNFQMLNPTANAPTALITWKSLTATHDLSTTTTNTIAHGLPQAPRFIEVFAWSNDGSSQAGYDGTTTACTYYLIGTNKGTSSSALRISGAGNQAVYSEAVITRDATNVTFTWTRTGADTGTAYLFLRVNT